MSLFLLPLERAGVDGRQIPTSIVVFAVPTGGFHGRVTSGSSPAQLAHTVPPIQVQGTSAISIAQARTALCKTKQGVKGWGPMATVTPALCTHAVPAAYTMLSHLSVSAAGEAGTTTTLYITEKTAETWRSKDSYGGVWNPQHPPPHYTSDQDLELQSVDQACQSLTREVFHPSSILGLVVLSLGL